MQRYIDAVLVAREFLSSNDHIFKDFPIVVNPVVRNAVVERARTFEPPIENVNMLKIETVEAGGSKLASILLMVENSEEHINPLLKTEEINEPHIIIASSLTPCWKRFALCRELMGIYNALDIEPKSTPQALYQGELESIAKNFSLITKEDDLDIEWYNFIVAVEIMLPWETRDKLHDMKDKHGMTNYEIASEFMVPEDIVDLYFNRYRAISTEVNRNLA